MTLNLIAYGMGLGLVLVGLDGRFGRQLRLFNQPQLRTFGMSAAELTTILNQIVSQLGDIMSFGLGGLTGIAFVIASKMEW
ncbi:MAG: hypothetical protein AB7U29_16540 [Desulfobulbus sp.]